MAVSTGLTVDLFLTCFNISKFVTGKGAHLRPSLDDLLNNTPAKTDEEEEEEIAVKHGKVIKFGWLDGVLMKCLLNIWGVMLYLRLTWVIGQAGMIEGLFIIGIANLVTYIIIGNLHNNW